MTGWIRRFFGSKQKAESRPEETPSPRSKKVKSFYLDPDEAKSLGNVEYMRTARKVEKTFMGGKYRTVESISAMEVVDITEKTEARPSPEDVSPQTSTPKQSQTPTSPAPRRQAGSDMDMFRNMARDIKRKS
ncbi:MAG: hypothetical protein HC921_08285 [Synechococcaceae cyanobacterium SM2_3_1]|nr:hypothetical protein [Synechococcaceae cyanobacterium SM2_3_1]